MSLFWDVSIAVVSQSIETHTLGDSCMHPHTKDLVMSKSNGYDLVGVKSKRCDFIWSQLQGKPRQQCAVSPKFNINHLLGTAGMECVCVCCFPKLQTNLYTSKYKCVDPTLPTGSHLVSFCEKINSLTRTYFCHTKKWLIRRFYMLQHSVII